MDDGRQITAGDPVMITDYDGLEHAAVALSGVEGRHDAHGRLIHDFPVVWVNAPRRDKHGTIRTPWPATAVRLASPDS